MSPQRSRSRTRKKNTWPQFIVIEILLTIVAAGALYAVASRIGHNHLAAMCIGSYGAGAGTVILSRRILPFLPRVTVQMPTSTTRRRPSSSGGKGKAT